MSAVHGRTDSRRAMTSGITTPENGGIMRDGGGLSLLVRLTQISTDKVPMRRWGELPLNAQPFPNCDACLSSILVHSTRRR